MLAPEPWTCAGRARTAPTASINALRSKRQRRSNSRATSRAVPSWRARARSWDFVVESHSREAIVHRERIFRCALIVADILAGLLVVGLVSRVSGEGPGLSALTLLPLLLMTNATSGIDNRDELLLRKSTLDEGPTVFQAATLTTVVAFLLEDSSAHQRHVAAA